MGPCLPARFTGSLGLLGQRAWRRHESKVGILGFSMGGFTTANAFGLEGKVPAAWIDGAPFTPKSGFEIGFTKAMMELSKGALSKEWIKKHVTDHVWADVEKEAAKQMCDLNEHLPEKEMPNGPDKKRPVFVTANKQDETVPYSSSVSLTELLKKYPKKYDLKEFWSLDGACVKGGHEFNSAHCVDFLTHTKDYNDKLCAFWHGVFGLDAKKCDAHTSRLYAVNDDAIVESAASNVPTFVMVGAVFATALTLIVVVARRAMKTTPTAEQIPEVSAGGWLGVDTAPLLAASGYSCKWHLSDVDMLAFRIRSRFRCPFQVAMASFSSCECQRLHAQLCP